MTSDLSLATAVEGQQQTGQARQQLAADFDQFLSLLTTQLQNQDPLDPTSSKELTDQLVQFTQVEQQINTNEKLDTISASLLQSLSSSALGFVGKNASYNGSEFQFNGELAPKIKYSIGESAAETTIRIFNESGQEVFTTDGQLITGAHEFRWNGENNDGQVQPEGIYQIVVDSLNAEGQAISTETLITDRVRGVETGSGGSVFLLIGDRAVSLNRILRVEEIPETAGSVQVSDNPATDEEEEEGQDDTIPEDDAESV